MTEDLKSQLRRVLGARLGRDRAVTARELVRITGQPDRKVRQVIEELIDGGFPVCSATEPPAGFFFPASVEEARRHARPLQKRAALIFLRKRKIIKGAALYYEPARQVELPL